MRMPLQPQAAAAARRKAIRQDSRSGKREIRPVQRERPTWVAGVRRRERHPALRRVRKVSRPVLRMRRQPLLAAEGHRKESRQKHHPARREILKGQQRQASQAAEGCRKESRQKHRQVRREILEVRQRQVPKAAEECRKERPQEHHQARRAILRKPQESRLMLRQARRATPKVWREKRLRAAAVC